MAVESRSYKMKYTNKNTLEIQDTKSPVSA